MTLYRVFFFFSSRRRHTRCLSDWSSDVCSSDLANERDRYNWSERSQFLGHAAQTFRESCARPSGGTHAGPSAQSRILRGPDARRRLFVSQASLLETKES